MEWGPRFLHERYGLPIFITENGLSCTDRIHLDGKVHDPERIDFTHRYLLALRQGIEAGADVQGYFHWSLLDNFEWSEGYNERFGLVYVDYPTGTRTPRDSAAWYRETIERQRRQLIMEKVTMNRKNKRGFALVRIATVVLVILAILRVPADPGADRVCDQSKKAGGHHRSAGCVDGFAGCADRMLRPVPGKL